MTMESSIGAAVPPRARPEEQRPEAIELSKELHTKLMSMRSEG